MDNNILLIAPLFFDYYKEIIACLERLGYNVTFFPDSHSNNHFVKAFGRINKNFINKLTHRFFMSKVLPVIKSENFSKVIIIASMNFSYLPSDIKMIREMNKNIKIIAYQWDSEKNMKYFTRFHKYMDKIYTFDSFDAKANKIYDFLPLFYLPIYENASKNKREKKYDCCYIGTAHPKKLAEINKISDEIKGALPNQFIYHYMPSKLKFFYHKVINKEYRVAKLKDFKYKKLTQSEIVNIMTSSFCVLDAPQGGQNGLTMRTFECLGSKTKLITSNKEVKKYDFYDERNILVYESRLKFDTAFFTEPYYDIPEEIYNSYSLESWLKKLLSD